MGTEKKHRLLEASELTAKIVLFLLIAFSVFVFVYYGMIRKGEVLEKGSVQFIESWTVIDSNGKEFPAGRTYVTDQDDQKDYTIIATLPRDIRDNEYLFFYTRRDIEVYINGELRDDFIEDRDVNIPGGSVKKFYMMVPLSQADAGAEVKMVRTSEIKDGQIVPETFISTTFGAYSFLMHQWGLSFILAVIVLIFAVVVIIVSIVLRFVYKLKIDMMYGAIGIAVLASWIITDSFLFPFFFGVFHVNGIMNYMICFMIPFGPSIYLNAVQRGRYKKSMSIILIISSVNAIVWPLLHFTGILPFYHTTNIINIILALLTLAAIVILIIDAAKKKIGEYRYTFIGFLGFLVCCLIEITIILSTTTTNEALPMVTGLALFLVFVVIQQVDDLRMINLEKQRAIDISEAKTRFLASMSHEIRTPINAILGMNEMILRENEDKVIGEYARSIKTSGKMLLMLVNDVLDFSKIEAGKLEIHETHFMMSDMLYDVLSLVKERADEKQLSLATELDDEIPNELISDEFRIRQILVNLLNNAVKYTDKGSVTLRLGGKDTGDGGFELHLAVEDTGKGISEDDREHLFEAFSRADLKSNANIEGTGLGLAIVKSIVDSMGGSINVESEYGAGSQFSVFLPVRYADRKPIPEDFMQNRTESNTDSDSGTFMAPDAKILAVDDNQSNLTIVKLFLKRTGIVPDLCSTGTHAMELCREKKYDLIILDHMMPQPDGIETLHMIKQDVNSLNRDTKAIVLTANAVAGSRQTYMDEGFDDYLTKPLDAKGFEQTVMNMLPKNKVKAVPSFIKLKNIPEDWTKPEEVSPLRKRLTAIEGLDFDKALLYCAGDEKILEEIVSDVASECPGRSERMRKNLAAKDLKAYKIDAHTIKSTMSTLGLQGFSDLARKHEFAARDNDVAFIEENGEGFIDEYVEICRKLKG
ncbi:MAG: response regulator [Eubacterium sp.]|nr:response regulator [Eubacterium sp.]